MTSRFGTGFIIIALAICLGSCVWHFEYVPVVLPDAEQKLKVHRPTECRHLYNNGTSDEWFECMGVGHQ